MIPKRCKRLAEVDFPIAEVDFPIAEVSRQAGAQIKAQAKRQLADLYPPDPDRAAPIAYL